MARYRFTSPAPVAAGASLRKEAPRPTVQYISQLESKYPNILAAVQAMWGFKELNMYFAKLTMDERGGREGFPQEVWDDLHTLLRLHQEIVPEALFSTNPSRHALDFTRDK